MIKALITIIQSLILLVWLGCFDAPASFADADIAGSLGQEQAAEKSEIEKMQKEMTDINVSADEALHALSDINTQGLRQGPKEIHLFCKEACCEIAPGVKINCLTYNGHLPGPTIHVQEGQLLKIILHNQMNVPTSLHFHGMILPQDVDGIPERNVMPGETYMYHFIAKQNGTFWYHPQIMHAEQKAKGLYGVIVVDSNSVPGMKTYDQDIVIVFSDMRALGSSTFFLMNGHCAPAIPPIELTAGSRIRLRLINAGQQPVPIHLSGHRFEIVSTNGDLTQTQTPKDTLTLGVSDRVDVEFIADNPGVWSFASEAVEQSTTNGKFPGGMVCVVHYVEKIKQ